MHLLKVALLCTALFLAGNPRAHAAAVSVGEVFSWAETRQLFVEYIELEEVGRRILGKIDADFQEGSGSRICAKLLNAKNFMAKPLKAKGQPKLKAKVFKASPSDEDDDWDHLVHALTNNPKLEALAGELARRIDRFLQDPADENDGLITIHIGTPSNVVHFEGDDWPFEIARPMAPGNLGWYGGSDPDWQDSAERPPKAAALAKAGQTLTQ